LRIVKEDKGIEKGRRIGKKPEKARNHKGSGLDWGGMEGNGGLIKNHAKTGDLTEV